MGISNVKEWMKIKTLFAGLTVLIVLPGSVLVVNAKEATATGPNYLNLRYNEDFSYLGDPDGSYIKDPWDPIKWIPIGDDWHLMLGGQARL